MTNIIAYNAVPLMAEVNKRDPIFYKKWIDLYKIFGHSTIGVNDRTGGIQFPIKTCVPEHLKLPEYVDTNITYRECCLARAEQILKKQEETDLPIQLMYSGGIDSTTILATFIDLLGVEETAKRITVVMNKESIDENPWFWYKFIRPHMNIQLSDLGYNDNKFGQCIYVTGELNDQLFGSDLQKDIYLTGGNDYLNNKIDMDWFIKYLSNKGMGDESATLWAEIFIRNLETCPNHNSTGWDVLWWYNFSWKWIYVYYRIFLVSKLKGPMDTVWLENNYYPFFADTNFQLWSMNSKEQKHQGSWQSYKYTAKKYICDVYGGNEYMQKVKRGSLQHILTMRPRSNFITEDYQLMSFDQLQFDDIYQPVNDIIKT